MASISVYLGAKPGALSSFASTVEELGQLIASNNHHLIYGGSSLGLMGKLAQSALSKGGKVTGIISKALVEKEVPLDNLNELVITETIQERKKLLQERADAFIILPGGLGTFEEMFETWNAVKIGTYKKPIGLLNYNGYFDKLIEFVDECVSHEFVTKDQASIPMVANTPTDLLGLIEKLCSATESS